jgi:hypothetical protein
MTPKWSEIDPKIHPKRPRIDPKSEKGRKRRNEELVDRCNGKGREEGKERTEKRSIGGGATGSRSGFALWTGREISKGG